MTVNKSSGNVREGGKRKTVGCGRGRGISGKTRFAAAVAYFVVVVVLTSQPKFPSHSALYFLPSSALCIPPMLPPRFLFRCRWVPRGYQPAMLYQASARLRNSSSTKAG